MFHRPFLSLLGGTLALALVSAQPVQSAPIERPAATEAAIAVSNPGRVGGQDGRADRAGRQSGRAAAPATPEENKAATQALLNAAAVECQVSEATLLGVTADQHSTFEAVCAGGPGYLVVGSTPPQTFNCLELAGQAETSRLRDPTADVGQQCTLAVNLDPLPVLSDYAVAAGIDCAVDQAAAIGKSNAGNLIYEIGCTDRDGYWIEKVGDRWKTSPCWDLILQNSACRYSTAEESRGAWSRVLAGTEAAGCGAREARRVGRDANSLMVYEVSCAGGDGYFARVEGATHTAQRIHACSAPEAAALAGGCKLGASATAAPTGDNAE